MTRMFALMLAITLLAGCSPPARVAAAVSAQGPPVGLLRVAWRAEDVPAPRHRLAVDGDRVMAISDTGVTAYDAATGRAAWSWTADAKLDGYRVTGRALVVAVPGPRSSEDKVIGIDTVTGRVLWETADPDWDIPTGLWHPSATTLADGGVLPTEDDGEIIGIEARTGEQRWSADPELRDDCGSDVSLWGGYTATDGSLALVAEACSTGTVRFHALDPATGEVRWVHERPGRPNEWSVSVASGVTSFSHEGGLAFIGPGGKSLKPDSELGNCTTCQLTAAGGGVVWGYHDERHDPRLAFIDTKTGRIRTTGKSRLDTPDQVMISGGARAYAIHWERSARPSLWVDVIDPAAAEWTRLPVPSAADLLAGETWLGTAGGRLLVASRSAEDRPLTLVAYDSVAAAKGRVELGGVTPEEWPDCAKMLAAVPGGRELEAADGKRAEDPIELGNVTLNRYTCHADMAGKGSVRIRVEWVAARPEEADAILDGASGRLPGPDEIMEVEDGSEMLIRVGRVLVRIDPRFASDSAVPNAIAEHLRSTR